MFFKKPFAPLPATWEIKILFGDIDILHMSTKNHDHMMLASRDMNCNRHIFCNFGPFFRFYSSIDPAN